MNGCEITLHGARLTTLGSGALWWADQSLLCVSDLHLCKSERMARRGGPNLPPYETRDTLTRLAADLDHTQARTVVCLGDSFDDLQAAQSLLEEDRLWITRLQAGRHWVWIEGNHDPGPIDVGGSHLAELFVPPLTFRHIATHGTSGEISGHYHPKVTLPTRGRRISRPAFLVDNDRLIMPAYGTYTGGLRSHDGVLASLMQPDASAILTGAVPTRIPMPRL
ncbi:MULTISPECIES: ligase-associated DNA damage response endonuclease PdeM [Roseobacteraceae]|jgi:DNA ligase-associated metallophosphoesterase|uniref:P_estr_lig_assc: metallophosphoesterase, DNA ligase-associated n=1 Tax=Pseudosulfitobacter pseudonitzschiae TaxID=1402135 RepID=A0A221K271_9RHOB|nr:MULTISPECIES: ligase-associated DNA damage response endonuclease PdeM [Roseobacteraceae]ASM72990.1 P_estr_lig_assc: metallophosphoesterase, DNA ligase-associated [Pseudosulfitobacter pseudonitzschiae]